MLRQTVGAERCPGGAARQAGAGHPRAPGPGAPDAAKVGGATGLTDSLVGFLLQNMINVQHNLLF